MNNMQQITRAGDKIEKSSFEVIDSEIGPHNFTNSEYEIVRRIIHSTADFEFKDLTVFSRNAVERGIEALKSGCAVITDVKMIQVGLNKNRLDTYGCRTYNFISDDDVIAAAKKNDTTRAAESMRRAAELGLLENSIVAVGNTPTSLIELIKICGEKNIRPALIIGVPVGFISAEESKEELLETDYPYILTRGRKGGSTIAVAIIHALLALSVKGAPEEKE